MTLIGKILAGRYEILEEVGNGGMAVVYKAKCQLLNRFVAVKVLRPDLQNDKEFVRRFNVEAQAAASLAHPNIVSIYDVGYEDGLHYIVMEYIEGKTLKDYIEEKRMLPWREAVDYAIQIAKGLEQAHKNSIIHRDIKPHNIIMTVDGVLKVTDFGIARANVQTTVTCEDSAIGSVHYISPEQARGGYTDERSDIYSLAVVMYEMLTGKVPFDSDRPVTVAIMHLQDKPVSPREYNISIPLALERIVMKAMSKEVSARYKNVSEMISELQSLLSNTNTATSDGGNFGFRVASSLDSSDDASDMGKTKQIPTLGVDGLQTATSAETINNDVGFGTDASLKMDATRVIDMNETSEAKNLSEEDNVSDKSNGKNKENQQKLDKKRARMVVLIAAVSACILVFGLALFLGDKFGIFTVCSSNNEGPNIPDVVGMLYEDAVDKYDTAESTDAKYRIDLVIKEYIKSDKPKGTILEQSPEPGSRVDLNSNVVVVRLTLSEGNNKIKLDDYVKQEKEQVRVELKNLGLDPEFQDMYHNEIPKGCITEQNPPAGSMVERGTKIKLFVSMGPDDNNETKEVPDFTGETDLDEIERRVKKLDFKFEAEKKHNDSAPMGEVYDQSPKPGSKMGKGTTITVYVSLGPEEKPEDNEEDHGQQQEDDNSGSSDSGKKKNYLTVYGPKNSERAQVEVKVDGKTVYSENLGKDDDTTLEIASYKDEVEVEIYYDGNLEVKEKLKMN